MTQQESPGDAARVPRHNSPPHNASQPGQALPRTQGATHVGELAMVGTVFAGIMLILAGLLQIVMGIAAIAGGRFYVVTGSNLFEFSLAGWGWLHLIVGILLVAVAVGVLTGKVWAFLTAIVLATFSAIDNFLFLPHYPIWSIIVIALDVLVIWSLAKRMSAELAQGAAARAQLAEPPRAATPTPQQDIAVKLAKLGEMTQHGLLSNEEFTAAKAKLLG